MLVSHIGACHVSDFLYWAPHIVHTPLQVPAEFYDRFDFMAATDLPTHERQTYHAMVAFADEAILNFTMATKKRDMWDNLLIIFSSGVFAVSMVCGFLRCPHSLICGILADNGGPVYFSGAGGANNYPLKGGSKSHPYLTTFFRGRIMKRTRVSYDAYDLAFD